MNQGWKKKTIGEICSIVNGGTPKTSNKEYWGSDHLWITPKDLGRLESIYIIFYVSFYLFIQSIIIIRV